MLVDLVQVLHTKEREKEERERKGEESEGERKKFSLIFNLITILSKYIIFFFTKLSPTEGTCESHDTNFSFFFFLNSS